MQPLFDIRLVESLIYAMVSKLHGFETFTNTDVSYVRSSQPRCHHIEKLISQNQLTVLQPAEWSSNSPDLNPVDFEISEMLEQNSYRGCRITYLETMRDALITEWNKIQPEKRNQCLDAFRTLDSSVSLNLKECISKNSTDELMNTICMRYLCVDFNNHSCWKSRNAFL